jgi:hypothetical protein
MTLAWRSRVRTSWTSKAQLEVGMGTKKTLVAAAAVVMWSAMVLASM